MKDYKDNRNMNLVSCTANLDINNFGMIETRLNSKPVSQNFVVWFMERYPENPLYAYWIDNISTKFFDDKIVTHSYIKEEEKLQTFIKQQESFY